MDASSTRPRLPKNAAACGRLVPKQKDQRARASKLHPTNTERILFFSFRIGNVLSGRRKQRGHVLTQQLRVLISAVRRGG